MNTVAIIEWLENAEYNLKSALKNINGIAQIQAGTALEQITVSLQALRGESEDDK